MDSEVRQLIKCIIGSRYSKESRGVPLIIYQSSNRWLKLYQDSLYTYTPFFFYLRPETGSFVHTKLIKRRGGVINKIIICLVLIIIFVITINFKMIEGKIILFNSKLFKYTPPPFNRRAPQLWENLNFVCLRKINR